MPPAKGSGASTVNQTTLSSERGLRSRDSSRLLRASSLLSHSEEINLEFCNSKPSVMSSKRRALFTKMRSLEKTLRDPLNKLSLRNQLLPELEVSGQASSLIQSMVIPRRGFRSSCLRKVSSLSSTIPEVLRSSPPCSLSRSMLTSSPVLSRDSETHSSH